MKDMNSIAGQLVLWSRQPTSTDVFVPPPRTKDLIEQCERIHFLASSTRILALPRDSRLRWDQSAAAIVRLVSQADDARRQFLHPLAQVKFRGQCMLRVEFAIDEAYKEAVSLGRDLERNYQFLRREAKRSPPSAPAMRALRRAQLLLGTPRAWCQGAKARNARGTPVAWNSRNAQAFSLVGALRAATAQLPPDDRRNAFEFVAFASRCRTEQALQEWNDRLGCRHDDVLQVIDKATKFLERRGTRWQISFDFDSAPDEEEG